jgi:hypothetical protein
MDIAWRPPEKEQPAWMLSLKINFEEIVALKHHKKQGISLIEKSKTLQK